jgi:cytochrome c-L
MLEETKARPSSAAFAGDGPCSLMRATSQVFASMISGLVKRAAVVVAVLLLPAGTWAQVADFKNPFNGAPIAFSPQPGEVETPAVKKFKVTGVDDYRGNAEAIAAGKALYEENCIVCHGADGKGKLGPTLVGNDLIYKQAASDPGMFSIIYGGASGAMQSFAKRGMLQDDMLKIIAYVRTLDK